MGIEALAIGSLAASVGSAAIGASGASATATANKQSAMYKAAVARNNAIIAEQNADAAIQAGDTQAEALGIRARSNVGAIRAGLAASGIDVNTGTAADVQTSADEMHLLDAATLRNDALRKAYAFRAQGTGYMAESQLDIMTAKNAERAGSIGVASSLLGGASSFADKWMTYNNRGMI